MATSQRSVNQIMGWEGIWRRCGLLDCVDSDLHAPAQKNCTPVRRPGFVLRRVVFFVCFTRLTARHGVNVKYVGNDSFGLRLPRRHAIPLVVVINVASAKFVLASGGGVGCTHS